MSKTAIVVVLLLAASSIAFLYFKLERPYAEPKVAFLVKVPYKNNLMANTVGRVLPLKVTFQQLWACDGKGDKVWYVRPLKMSTKGVAFLFDFQNSFVSDGSIRMSYITPNGGEPKLVNLVSGRDMDMNKVSGAAFLPDKLFPRMESDAPSFGIVFSPDGTESVVEENLDDMGWRNAGGSAFDELAKDNRNYEYVVFLDDRLVVLQTAEVYGAAANPQSPSLEMISVLDKSATKVLRRFVFCSKGSSEDPEFVFVPAAKAADGSWMDKYPEDNADAVQYDFTSRSKDEIRALIHFLRPMNGGKDLLIQIRYKGKGVGGIGVQNSICRYYALNLESGQMKPVQTKCNWVATSLYDKWQQSLLDNVYVPQSGIVYFSACSVSGTDLKHGVRQIVSLNPNMDWVKIADDVEGLVKKPQMAPDGAIWFVRKVPYTSTQSSASKSTSSSAEQLVRFDPSTGTEKVVFECPEFDSFHLSLN